MKITLSTLLALAAMTMAADSVPAAKDKPAESTLPKNAAPMPRDMEMDYEDYRGQGYPDTMDEHWHGGGGHWHGGGGGGHWHGGGGHWHGGGGGGHWHGRGGHWHGGW
ncbi:hypothetical protein SDRG_15929 [Saprolegnia diclina VS20]|uniref:Glycine-rich protein n=1 Tax=Saprolegnia diclina (strain VS20) TaxID=1156394 RepID=T0PVD8_SAPDV|nr:hypothetical protein SDRG_15929 [Saprolegnia diclina VS20]EQC26236.1 hypothetical protein SDRG_15929 [Saprolegnia diclina VS20]|eukprot:XP_008620337.1 hypothetical protein SDRG_15929 [Saprolegnia diclina VS20]